MVPELTETASPGARLRTLLARPTGLVSSAVWDCMTARVLEDAGYEGLFVSGAAVSGARLGMPDFAFLGLADMADTVRNITRAVDVPVLVDADTGYGNALNAVHAARTYHAAGAAGMLLEDQVFPKRCGQLAGKDVVPLADYMPKLRAVLAERPSPDFLILARTDALAAEGPDRAIERAQAFVEAGADITFVEAARTIEEVERIGREVPGPKMYNLSSGGVGPHVTVSELLELGFSWIVFPALTMGAVTHGVREMAEQVLRLGHDEPILATGFSPAGLATLFGGDEWRELEQRYATEGGER